MAALRYHKRTVRHNADQPTVTTINGTALAMARNTAMKSNQDLGAEALTGIDEYPEQNGRQLPAPAKIRIAELG